MQNEKKKESMVQKELLECRLNCLIFQNTEVLRGGLWFDFIEEVTKANSV